MQRVSVLGLAYASLGRSLLGLVVAAAAAVSMGHSPEAQAQVARQGQTEAKTGAKSSAKSSALGQPSQSARRGQNTISKSSRASKSPRFDVRRASKTARSASGRKAQLRMRAVPAVPSIGQSAGLHAVSDPLDLKSGVALVVDEDTQQVLVSKNPNVVLPIASITKLMTALVVVEAGLPMDEMLGIGHEDVENTLKTRSRLLPGTVLSRSELLRLALMASENRAAAALARHYPGGVPAFVAAMNRKSQQLGMRNTRFVEATGLSAENRASAMDLARLVAAASAHDTIREYSVSKESVVPVGAQDKAVQFRSTNGLIGNPEWDIQLQKTGYISAAGRCLVMQASMAGRKLTLVLLDSAGKYSRFGDAERIRKWLVEEVPGLSPSAALPALVPVVATPGAAAVLLPR